MERYKRDGKWFEREYDEDGILAYDSYDDYDESREDDVESSNYYDGYYDPEHKYPVIEETEYDDEGYEVARWIPSMVQPKTHAEIIADMREQRKISVWVIIGCLLFILACFGLAILIVKP